MTLARFGSGRRRKNRAARSKTARPKAARRRPARRPKTNRRKLKLWQRIPDLRPKLAAALPLIRGRVVRLLPSLAAACVVAGIGVAGVFGYRWVTTSEQFAARHIVVYGNDRVTATDVETALAIPTGTNIFSIGLSELERRLETNPWVANANIRRELPNTLRVNITEHKPAAVVQLGGLYLVDSKGNAFKRADFSAGEGAGLPVISGIERDDYLHRPEAAKADIRKAMRIAEVYRAGEHRPRLGEVHLDGRSQFVVYTYDHAVAVRVGSGDEQTIASRLRFFDAAWKSLDTEQRARARTIYVDNTTRPDHITVAFRN